MSSSMQRKADSRPRQGSDTDPQGPGNARPADESPTVISKTPPIVDAAITQQASLSQLTRKTSPEALVAGLRGKQLAHFELIETIGVGGMAAVIRARDMQLDRFVALKILPPEMASEPENVRRFHQEARAAAKLDHENIARVFYCGEDHGLHFIAFEYVEGINLRTMIEQRGRLPVAEAVRYILQVATGLEHAATRGVVHRDVKPSNIIITPTGRAKLVDMGLARNLERRGETELTQSGMTLGTFDYISPEQALEPRDADVRSDIYSLGCTFYHLLTGHAPVPEGTPAKKLQHHQHQAPIDPRQIDPTIPDEVVMVLSKMMAKNPNDRYQRPIHLVHHLMQVARKVGAADDLPEGVMFVDAPLPGQPRSRPILYIGAALVALVALTLMASFVPEPRPVGPVVMGNNNGGDADDQKGKPNSKPQPSQVVTPPPTRPDTVISQADLNAVFADADSPEMKVTVDASGMIELNGMAFKGGKDRRLLLEGAQDAESNVLRFDYANNARLVGVTVEGGEEVVFRKIKFQLDTATPLTPNQAVAPVAVRGAKRVRFEQCIFLQNKVQKISTPPASDAKRVPLASLLIDVGDKPAYPQTIVDIDECYFDSNRENGGQVAIAINGPAKVTVTNTAFRPHSAFFSFRDKCTLANTDLLMKNCTCFVVGGPAFRLSDRASARVRAQNSVFSRPGGESLALSRVPGLAEPGLIYLSDAKQIRYSGEQNLYHLLNDLVELKKGGFKDSKKDFLDFLGPTSSDVNSTYISVAESANNPLTFANPLKEDSVLAFQLREEYAQPNLGLQRTWLGQAMPRAISAAPPLVKNPAPKKNIVDPDDARRKADEFANIAEALSRAKSGDVIEIKHVKDNREVEIPPIALKPGLNVTLKAHEGYQPVLVLDKAYKDKDSALFKLLEGKLQFEQLGFVLDPQALGFESQSVVHLGEAAHCAFKQCVVTLKAQSDVQLNVATLVDLNLMMKMDTAPPPARLEFHDCFIRGRGDLVSLRGSRVLNVEMKNSLVVLDGSLLDVTASDKAAMRPQDGVRWKMERTSAFTTDSIFALRSRTANGLARTDADVKGCLLVSLRPERPIVLLDMKTGDLERYLKWEGDQNSYANFDKDNVDAWKNLFGGANADFGKITLPRLTEKNMQSLWDAEPDWLRPTDQTELDRIQNVGIPADIEMKLLQPLDTEEP